ncbi:hypothetical protein [Actinophytocola gossypii]|uniref:Uncharacterized protein n=1 Tax=Actinophytocola gossypii TaxID=2812003 RepID=A0ABT2JGT8_9PSEU|nr:hypothetical protein [Actinophytocola gossypii]MCT2586494.1 hypothetical protein [Actinophytocola gossypii]
MQTWAKRGLRTALVTGGLLMLGTGIASADEDVNPDRPASPLDVGVHVPIHLDNNALGTPVGQQNLPGVDRTVSVSPDDVVNRVPAVDRVVPNAVARTHGAAERISDHLVGRAAPAVREAAATVEPVNDEAVDWFADTTTPVNEVAGVPALPRPTVPRIPETNDGPRQNSVDADLVVPVDVSGNAFAAAGRAHVRNESHHRYDTGELVVADGRAGFLAGNAVDLDWAAPVQVNGNAAAVFGRAGADNESSLRATSTSDVFSNGRHGVLAGNVGAVHGATPVQLSGNAIAGGGVADAESDAQSAATAGGWVRGSGADGAGSGNVAGVPVATPVKVNGNGIAGFGAAEAESAATADALAGDEEYVMYGRPTYLATNGDPAFAAGNVVQPAVSGPAMFCGNAGVVSGIADAECASDSETVAGGDNRTSGRGSVGSGAVAHPAVALPVRGFGNAVSGGGVAQTAVADHVDSTAGGASYTRGHDGVLSGTAVSGGPSGPVDLFANAVTASGVADALAYNDSRATAGGASGTTGDNSAAGGNMVAAPVALPVEGFGTVAGVSGAAESVGTEQKVSTSGGYTDSRDDYGLFASNVVSSPVAGAVQTFGNGAGLSGATDTKASTDNEVTAGGDSGATGVEGIGSANIGQLPVTAPVQLFGTGASALGRGDQTALAANDLTAGGDSTSDGTGGLLSGNVANTPVGTAAQAFGDSAAVLGRNHALAASDTETETGGDTDTTGASALGSGNVVAPQAMPVVQGFAHAVSGVGGANSAGVRNENRNTAGGDIDTAGAGGVLSGNVADVPARAVVQPFGDAAAALGSRSVATGDNESASTIGGTTGTSGDWGSLSGIDRTVPVASQLLVYDVPLDVLAKAMTFASDEGDAEKAEGRLTLPKHAPDLSPTSLPSLLPSVESLPSVPEPRRAEPTRTTLPDDELAGSFTGVLDAVAEMMADVPGLPGHDEVSAVSGMVTEVSDAVTVQVPGRPRPIGRVAHPFTPLRGDLFDTLPLDTLLPANLVPGDLLGNGLLGGQRAGDHRMGDYLTGGGPAYSQVDGDLTNADLVDANLPVADGLANAPIVGGLGLPLGGGRDLPVDGGIGDLPVVGGLSNVAPGGLGDLTAPIAGRTNLPIGLDGLPLADGLAGLPAVGGLGRSGLPVEGLDGLPVADGLAGLPVVGDLGRSGLPVEGLDGLPVADGLAGLPAVGGLGRSGLPVEGLNGLPVADGLAGLPVVGDLGRSGLPVDGLNGLPVADGLDGLPAVGGLGRSDLPVRGRDGLPLADGRTDLPAVDGLPVPPVVDGLGDVPVAGGLGLPVGGGRSDLPLVGELGLPVGNGTTNLPLGVADGLAELPFAGVPDLPVDLGGGLPARGRDLPAFTSNATETTAVIPQVDAPTAVLPNLTDVELTRPLPAVPAFGDVPVVRVPSMGHRPVQVPAVDPAVNSGTLTDTRAALANLFTYHPIG